MGRELDDESTASECQLQQGSCIIVNFVPNINGRAPRRQQPPSTFNIQHQRAEEIQVNSDELVEICMTCCTPSVVMMLSGLFLVFIWIIRMVYKENFSIATDVVIGILNIIYIVVLVRYFIVRH